MIAAIVRLLPLLLLGSLASAQPAQPPQPPQPLSPPAVPEQPDREPAEAIARDLMRMALLDLRTITAPTAADYRAALTLLSFAHDLDPTNLDITRRQIEAAHRAGDRAAVLEHTRALLLRDPADTVATLRLITATIEQDHNIAEDRLRAYDRFINNSRLDASIRSRLALDAALLLRERGDDRAFKDKLLQSMQLDSTHKEAALLAATFFAERVDTDPAGRIDLLVNLLKSDPIDPNIHLSIARELVIGGAYAAALRFHSNGYFIASTISPPGDAAIVENRVLMWYVRGPADLIKSINDALAAERDAAARAIRRAQDLKRPTDNLTKPEDVQLPPPVMVLYILAADAAGDTAAATGGMQELTRSVERIVEKLRNPRTRGQVTEADASRLMLESVLQLYSLRLWTGIDAAKVNESQDTLRSIRQAYPEAGVFLDALWALRNDRPQETIDLCTPISALRTSKIALGLAYERLGQPEKAIEYYADIFRSEPLQAAAAWARSRATALGANLTPPQAKSLAALVADPRVPAWIDQLAINPDNFVRITASVPSNEVDAASFQPIRLRLTNQSPIPLALGPDRPLNSRFLIAPKFERSELELFALPEVVDLDQRFRLLPRQSIEVDVWPTGGYAGWTMDALANRSIRLRWKLIQGFVADTRGSYRPGPLCLETETDALLIRPLAASALTPLEIARSIQAAPLENLRRLACVTRAALLQPLLLPDPVIAPDPKDEGAFAPPPAPAPDFKPVAQAFANRYASLPPATRAMLALIVPHSRLAPDMAALDAVIRSDQHPLVRAVALCTRVADPTDQNLTAAISADDPSIAAIASAVEARLKAGLRFYALLTPADIRPGPGAPK